MSLEQTVKEVSNRYSSFEITEALKKFIKKKEKTPEKKPSKEKTLELPQKEDSKITIPELPKIDEEDSITKIDEEDEDSISEEDQIDDEVKEDIDYAHHIELVARSFYEQKGIDYVKMFYGDEVRKSAENIYQESEEQEVKRRGNITEMEAEKTFKDVQYATVIGGRTNMNQGDLEDFDMWIKFNRSMFAFFQTAYGITDDVNYKPL